MPKKITKKNSTTKKSKSPAKPKSKTKIRVKPKIKSKSIKTAKHPVKVKKTKAKVVRSTKLKKSSKKQLSKKHSVSKPVQPKLGIHHALATLPESATVQPIAPPEKLPEGALSPNYALLPDWEDCERLKRFVVEAGLSFYLINKTSSEFKLTSSMLKGKLDLPNHFVICAKDRSGKIIGAIDGHMINNTLVVNHSHAEGNNKRELHILLYSVALPAKVEYVVCYSKIDELTVESAGSLILLGRGFGMSAIAFGQEVLFVRRVKKELDPIATGAEISALLKELDDPQLSAKSSDFEKKTIVPLTPLPISPDRREHLHEIRDVVELLKISPGKIDKVMDALKDDYVLGRMDLTPEDLFL